MNTRQQSSQCRVLHFTGSHLSGVDSRASVTAQLRSGHTMNLAALAQAVRSDRHICHLVTETARRESGCNSLRLEDAIVLLGGQGLYAIFSASLAQKRHESISSHTSHQESRTPPANLRLLETLQGERK